MEVDLNQSLVLAVRMAFYQDEFDGSSCFGSRSIQPRALAITANYRPGSSLDYLFVGDLGAVGKQAFMSGDLDIIESKTNF